MFVTINESVLMCYFSLKSTTFSNFLSFPLLPLFWIQSRSQMAFSHCVPLGSPWLWQFLRLFFLWPWQFWGKRVSCFVKCLWIGVCLRFPSWLNWGYTLPTKVRLVKAVVFAVVMYGCESWTIKKAEHQRIDAFECGVGEDSWESLGLQGDLTSPS